MLSMSWGIVALGNLYTGTKMQRLDSYIKSLSVCVSAVAELKWPQSSGAPLDCVHSNLSKVRD